MTSIVQKYANGTVTVRVDNFALSSPFATNPEAFLLVQGKKPSNTFHLYLHSLVSHSAEGNRVETIGFSKYLSHPYDWLPE
jgi:hypothetical protein